VPAASAREAVDRLTGAAAAGVPFDVLVSDIGMPDEDGYMLIRQVRTLPPDAGGAIPALALTAYARPEDRQQALRNGFQSHLAKPAGSADLAAAVAALVRRTAGGGGR
jgi:CheY-like chemotaxis protein